MKVSINAEVSGQEVIDEFVIPKINEENGIVVNTGEVKVSVFSEKKNEYIDFDSKNVKFIFKR